MITPANIAAHEWIGLKIKIIQSSNQAFQGLEGIIRDETMNTFTLQAKERLVQIQKQGTRFRAQLPMETVELDISALRFRPEDRVKKGLR